MDKEFAHDLVSSFDHFIGITFCSFNWYLFCGTQLEFIVITISNFQLVSFLWYSNGFSGVYHLLGGCFPFDWDSVMIMHM